MLPDAHLHVGQFIRQVILDDGFPKGAFAAWRPCAKWPSSPVQRAARC